MIFVHGFGSSPASWGRLLELLRSDPRIASLYDFDCFAYPTAWFSANPLTRIPRLREIARALQGFIESPQFQGRELTLVGHSQGGLVIQTYIAALLEAGEGEKLGTLRQVIVMATPNLGSTLASPIRRVLGAFFPNPQERSLRVLDPEIADIRAVIRQRVLGARSRSANTWPVPMHSFYGLRDGVVVEASARGSFLNLTPLDADHFSILQPRDLTDQRYVEFAEVLLYPSGHAHQYEIDRFGVEIDIGPAPDRQLVVTHGTTTRTVETETSAHIRRTVTFSPKNRCRSPFPLRYATRFLGFVGFTASHPNEATPEELGRYTDYGTEALFRFTPQAGKTYTMEIDVFKGFDRGNRDMHFHLGRESYYQTVAFSLDLSRFVAAGQRVTKGPTLYYHDLDPPSHDLCSQRGFGRRIEPAGAEGGTVWKWELRRVREGVIDIAWDVSDAGSG